MKKNTTCLPLSLLLLLCSPFGINAQVGNTPEAYAESPDDPYIFVPRQSRATSPAFQLTTTGFSIRQVNVNDASENMLGDAANEPSLAIDPMNPDRMAIGWRQFDTIASNFRQAGYGYSNNDGENWTFPEPIEPGIFRSDPVLEFDAEGDFFYNSLKVENGIYECQVFTSASGTNTWDTGVYAYGGDKQWMAVDRTNGTGKGNVYAFWKAGISACTGSFTRSVNNGLDFEACLQMPDDPTRGTLVVGPNGEIYACGGTGDLFHVLKSSNAGVPGEDLEWDFSVALDLGGAQSLYAGPNPTGMLGQAWIDVDASGGDTHGNVYLLTTTTNFFTSDPADITFIRSTDGGETWNALTTINDDNSNENWQWFGSLSVAPTGRIDVTWLDTRDNPGTYLSRLYYAYSLDGGLTWSPNEALSEPFDPHLGFPQQTKIGDYYHQRSDETGVHLAWAATFNGEEDVYYSYIQPDLPSNAEAIPAASVVLSRGAPNPFSEQIRWEYLLRSGGEVQLEIFDVLGSPVQTLVHEFQPAGNYSAAWDGQCASGQIADGGIYFFRMSLEGNVVGAGRVVLSRTF